MKQVGLRAAVRLTFTMHITQLDLHNKKQMDNFLWLAYPNLVKLVMKDRQSDGKLRD